MPELVRHESNFGLYSEVQFVIAGLVLDGKH
jgi:hypothetical protein